MIQIVKATKEHLPELARLLKHNNQCEFVLGSKYPFTPLLKIYETGWLYVVLRNENIGGMFFLTDIDNRCAKIHFGMFATAGMELISGTIEVLNWLVPEHFDTLFGWINMNNSVALRFALVVGFKNLSIIKNGEQNYCLTVFSSSK